MNPADTVADALLIAGAVTICAVRRDELFPIVEHRRSTYLVRWRRGSKGWSCSCPYTATPCAHVRAVQTVTDVERSDP